MSSALETSEPIAADFRDRKDGRENGALKLIAGLMDIGLDELVQREKQAERARRTRANLIAGAMAILAAGALAGGAFAFINGDKAARRAADLNVANMSLEERRREVEAQNTQLEQQRDALDAQLTQITRLSTQMTSVVAEITDIAATSDPVPEKLLFLSYGARIGVSAAALDLLFEAEFGRTRELGVQAFPGVELCLGAKYCATNFTVDQFRADWADRLAPGAVDRLAAAWDSKDDETRRALRDIVVPRKEAISVFGEEQLPREAEMVRKIWPKADDLPPDSFGALISILINTGPRGLTALAKEAGDDPVDVPAAIVALGKSYAFRPSLSRFAAAMLRRRERKRRCLSRGWQSQSKRPPGVKLDVLGGAS